MKVVFMGTPEFAALPLEMLIKEKVNIQAVVTQPDRPVGRKRIITPPPVKKIALKHNIPVYQPENVKEKLFIDTLNSLQPDLITVVAFGQILPLEVLELPQKGCINVHASLLPKYRGAAPIQWAIINGEAETGVTTMWMDEGLDTGDIFLQKSIKIKQEWTTLELSKELSHLGGNLLLRTIEHIENNNLIRVSQQSLNSTYAPMLKKEDGKINWSKKTSEIYNLIRGTYPWPGAFTIREGKQIKIWKAKIYDVDQKPAPGKFIGEIKNKGFLVGTGDGILLISELQEAGRKRLKATEYLAGHSMEEGEYFADS